MKLSNAIIEEVVREMCGNESLAIVWHLKKKKNLSEARLSEATGREINNVRSLVYRLYEAGLASFTKKRDKKKGWYVYYWSFRLRRVIPIYKEIRRKRLLKSELQLKREIGTSFFTCPKKCIRMDFEQGVEFNFKCPECGSLLGQDDNEAKIKMLEMEIKELKGA